MQLKPKSKYDIQYSSIEGIQISSTSEPEDQAELL